MKSIKGYSITVLKNKIRIGCTTKTFRQWRLIAEAAREALKTNAIIYINGLCVYAYFSDRDRVIIYSSGWYNQFYISTITRFLKFVKTVERKQKRKRDYLLEVIEMAINNKLKTILIISATLVVPGFWLALVWYTVYSKLKKKRSK